MLNRWQGNTGKFQRIDEKNFEEKKFIPPQRKTSSGFENILEKIGKIGAKEPFENEDIILLLILYLMYRESGDSELLIIMGAMFLL